MDQMPPIPETPDRLPESGDLQKYRTIDLAKLAEVKDAVEVNAEFEPPADATANMAGEVLYKTPLEDPPGGYLVQADSYAGGEFVRGADCLADGNGTILFITLFDRDPEGQMTIDMYNFRESTVSKKIDPGNSQSWENISETPLADLPETTVRTVIDATKLRMNVL